MVTDIEKVVSPVSVHPFKLNKIKQGQPEYLPRFGIKPESFKVNSYPVSGPSFRLCL